MKRGCLLLALLLLLLPIAACSNHGHGSAAEVSLTYADPMGIVDSEELSRLCALGKLKLSPAAANGNADVWIVPAQDWRQYLKQGNFRTISQSLYEHNAFFSARANGCTEVFGRKGELLAVPRSLWAGFQGKENFIFFRKAWTTNLGYENLEGDGLTWETTNQLLADLVRKDPDGDQIRNTWGMTLPQSWESLQTVLLDNFGVRDWVLENGQWVPGLTSSRAKQAFGWLSQWMRQGLLQVQPADAALEQFVQGQTGMLVAQNPEAVQNAWSAAHPEGTGALIDQISVLALSTNPYGVRFVQGQTETAVLLFSSSVSDEAVQAALDTMDRFLEARAHTDTSTWPASCRSVQQVRWHDYAWRQPMFTDYVSDPAIQDYTQSLQQAADRTWWTLAATSSDPEAGWQAWLTEAGQMAGGPEAAAAVTALATELGVQKEE